MKKLFLYVLLAVIPICLLSCSKNEDSGTAGNDAVTKEFLVGPTWKLSEMYGRSYENGKLTDETDFGPDIAGAITMDFYEDGIYREIVDGGEDSEGRYLLGENGIDIQLTAYDRDGEEYARPKAKIRKISTKSFSLTFYWLGENESSEEERIFIK